MSKVRYGIIGIGNMGTAHAQSLLSEIKGAELTAVCDIREERLKWAEEKLPENVRKYSTPKELFESRIIDAVLI
ncbi:Gfo/Idh/MocA family oxidoreductase, partial [Paenibacillus sp.]